MREPGDIDAIKALHCADCARSDSAALDLAPVDHMPIPTEALAGFPDGVPGMSRLDRRRFLRNGFLGFASVYAASKIPWVKAFEAAVAEGAVPNSKLVMVFLNGGNDGGNTFIPFEQAQYDAYAALRPTIKRAQGGTGPGGSTVMPGTGGRLAFANVLTANGTLGGLDTLWGPTGDFNDPASRLALFPATDYPNPNFSHFTSRDWWFAGALQQSTTGWLGRWLDLYGSTANPLQAVSIGSNVSKMIRAAKAPVSSVPETLAGFGFSVGGAPVNGDVGTLVGAVAGNASTARSRTVYGQTVQVAQQLGGVTHTPGANYPANSSLSRRLQLAATLLSANLGTRIVTIDWGSFDTHGNQVAGQDPQLTVLAQALSAFQADLVARGIDQQVTTVVFSEFGRRAGENLSFGTDHGAGGPLMVSGTKVRGGLGGAPAPMTASGLVRGNLAVTTDFRTVYASIINEWLGGDASAVLPGGPFALTRDDGAPSLFRP
jgi:uncharacterized protein (DUF1501 family)